MASLATFVGLDYHDDSVRVCVLDGDGTMRFNRDLPNDAPMVRDAILAFGDRVDVAIEACCGAADFATELKCLTAWNVRQAHPGYVAQLKKSPDKTDFGDARLLADLLRVGYLPEVWLPDLDTRELRKLVRYRQSLAADRRDVKLRLRAVLRDQRVSFQSARPWSKAWMEWLKTVALPGSSRWVVDELLDQLGDLVKRISRAETKLDETTCDDPVCQKLLTMPGVGLITAVTLRAEIGHFERFGNGKKLARFCGVTPRNASSGKRQADAGLVGNSNTALRAVLIQAAQRLPRCDPKWKEMKDRLKNEKKKPSNVVTAAIANRWLRWLYHQMVTPVTELPVTDLAA